MKKVYLTSWLIGLFCLFWEFAHGGNPACNVGEGSGRCVRVPCPTYVNFQPVSMPTMPSARRASAADLAYANVNVAAEARLKKEAGILLENEPITIDRADYTRLAQPGNRFALLLSDDDSQLMVNIGRADNQQPQRWMLPGNLLDKLPLELNGNFVRPDEVPLDLRFDGATHVLRLSNGQGMRFQSFQLKADEVDLLGYSMDFYDVVPGYKINNDDLNTSSYSDLSLNVGDVFEFVNDIASTDRSEHIKTHSHIHCDAFGLLETPNGTFNALRFTSRDTSFSYQGSDTTPSSQSVSQRVGWITKEGVLFDGHIQAYDPVTGQATLVQMNYQTISQPTVPVSVSVSNPQATTSTTGQPFSQTFTASGGSAPYSYSVTSGALPQGLSLAGDGVLSGTPTLSGSFSIAVQATDANGVSGTGTAYNLQVIDPEILGGSDLTPGLSLPMANFVASGPEATRTFTISIQEVIGKATTKGTVVVTLTIPLGYTMAFDNALTSTTVSGGGSEPVSVNNNNWNATSTSDLQLTLTLKSGEYIAANGKSVLGIRMSRVGASIGTANITVNVSDDPSKSYDSNSQNNIYVRNINAL